MTEWYWRTPVRLRDLQVVDDDGHEVCGRVTMSLDMYPPILVVDFGECRISARPDALEPVTAPR